MEVYVRERSLDVDTDTLPVVVPESCYARCRNLCGLIVELQQTALDRENDELALICEGKGFLSACKGIVVRTGDLSSTVSGPVFGERNASEQVLSQLATHQNETVPAEAAFNKVKK